MYSAAEPLFQDPSVCALHHRDQLVEHLGITFLPPGEEPLYDENARKQTVRSWNMHEELSASECDRRLQGSGWSGHGRGGA